MGEGQNVAQKTDFAPLLKLVFDLGPLGVFFFTNAYYGIFFATGAFMATTIVSLVASKLFLHRIPIMALVTGIFVIVFGALTIYLENDTFIKVKPTIVNLTFASILASGLYFRRTFLKVVLGEVFHLREEGWRILTIRWACFFVLLAVLNEIVWRNFSTDNWVAFKVFGIMPLTFLFMMAQITLITRFQVPEDEAGKNED
jgi:intracellular septation protein